MVIKKWLKDDYPDYLELINRTEAGWKATGRGTRRNWWDVLAGLRDGTPVVIDGQQFPVLRTARERKGWAHVSHAECRNENEIAADFRFGRWGKKKKSKLPKKAKPVARKAKRMRHRKAS